MKWYEKVAKAGKTFVKGVVDVTHVALDVAGCIPGIGVIPDLINGGIYALEGDGVNMLFSLAVAAPIIGDSVAIGKLAKRADGAVSAAVGMAKGLKNLPELEKVKPLVKILKRKLDKLFDFLDFSDELRSLMTKMLSKISGLMKEGGKLLNKFGKKLKQQLIKLKNKIKNLLKKDPKGNGKPKDPKGKGQTGDDALKNGKPRSKHKVEKGRTLQGKGEPNSSADLLNPDGTVKQRRYYGKDGRPEVDIDYNHTDDGTHTFPHRHIWDWNKVPPRQDSR